MCFIGRTACFVVSVSAYRDWRRPAGSGVRFRRAVSGPPRHTYVLTPWLDPVWLHWPWPARGNIAQTCRESTRATGRVAQRISLKVLADRVWHSGLWRLRSYAVPHHTEAVRHSLSYSSLRATSTSRATAPLLFRQFWNCSLQVSCLLLSEIFQAISRLWLPVNPWHKPHLHEHWTTLA